MEVKWLKAFHKSIHNLIIKRKMKGLTKEREFLGLDQAKSIAILYNAFNAEAVENAIEFGKVLGKNKSIYLLGFINKKNNESIRDLYPDLGFISKKDLSWYRVPKRLSSSRFIKGEYDILINYYLIDSLSLQYISALSNAKFRIGHYRDQNLYCNDFLIDLGETQSLEELQKLILHFIKNKKTQNEPI